MSADDNGDSVEVHTVCYKSFCKKIGITKIRVALPILYQIASRKMHNKHKHLYYKLTCLYTILLMYYKQF